MKKTIVCVTLFLLVSSCVVTTAMAVPKITNVKGGLGVTANIEDAKGRDWQILINGPGVFFGMKTTGTISSKNEIIRTSMTPPAFGIGPITVAIRINRVILPDVISVVPALMIGPIVLIFDIPK